jgi:hypothetical protein
MGRQTQDEYARAAGELWGEESNDQAFWLGGAGFLGLILGIVLFCIQLGMTDSGTSCPEGKQSIFVAECGEPALAILGLILMIVGGVLTVFWIAGWVRLCGKRSGNQQPL